MLSSEWLHALDLENTFAKDTTDPGMFKNPKF